MVPFASLVRGVPITTTGSVVQHRKWYYRIFFVSCFVFWGAYSRLQKPSAKEFMIEIFIQPSSTIITTTGSVVQHRKWYYRIFFVSCFVFWGAYSRLQKPSAKEFMIEIFIQPSSTIMYCNVVAVRTVQSDHANL